MMKQLLKNNTLMVLFTAACLPFMSACSSDEVSLPSVSSESDKDTPSEVLEKAEEIFNQRFAKVDDDYFQVYLNYTDNFAVVTKAKMEDAGMNQYAAEVSKVMLTGMENSDAPHLISASLFQLKDLETTVTSHEITDADKLNNITWKGEIKVTAKNMRKKNLDLMDQFKSLKSSSDTTEIHYTSPKITLSVCGKSWVEYFTAQKNKKAATMDDPTAFMGDMFSVVTNQVLDSLIPSLEGSEWSDWSDSKEYTFQKCTMTVKDGEILWDSEEDANNIPENGTSFSTLPPLTGPNSMLYEQTTDRFVAIKPNIEFLKEHNLLEDGTATNND